ncbi:MAG: TonB family protein [Chloroflexota bacterium]
MDTFIMYLLRSAVWLSGFAIVYMVFLQRERYFLLKRVYLITGILVSFIFPLITIHYPVEIQSPTFTQVVSTQADMFPAEQTLITPAEQEFSLFYLLAGVYVSGVVFFFAKNLYQFRNLLKSIKKSKISNLGAAKLIRNSDFTSSFSFFNYVFVNPSVSENEVKEIMNHELVHVHQKHWFDLALGEFLRMLQWANPFAWIYTGFIRLNHEYLADEVALQRSSDPALYKAALLNQLFRSPVISLSNPFNYSITKTRFDMMKKIVTSPYRKLKVLMVLPVFAIVLYAFSVPEYRYIASEEYQPVTLTINQPSPLKAVTEIQPLAPASATRQQAVKGTVKDADGKPVAGAHIVTTGATNPSATTENDGTFSLASVPKDASFLVIATGFKSITVKAVYDKPMDIRLEKDPDYKFIPQTTRQEPLVVVDGDVTDKKYSEIRKELGHNFGTQTMIQGQQALDKYGEKAANGVVEILTRKKAIEMGLNPPYPRIGPEDYPTFQGEQYFTFNKWVLDRITYPEEAKSNGIEGWVSVNYAIEKGGTVKIVEPGSSGPKILVDEVVKIILSGPGFERPKNPEADEQLTSGVTLRFKLPDQVIRDSPPFVVVEEMPAYPGGDAALLQFIKENTRYPEELKKDKIEGRAIVRFIVTPEGNTEGITVMKGVNPLMDAEAMRVVSSIKGWNPGKQGGKAVNVWYMCPVNFTPSVE